MNLLGDNYNIGIPLAFLGGIGMSFSACIYPLLPVFLGMIIPYTQKARFRGFLLGFAYVSGFAFIYSLLGIIAALTGSIFGQLLNYPLVRIGAGVVFIIFGLSLLDIFYIKHISFAPSLKPFNHPYLKLFFMGLNSGLIISPCVSPVLGAILLYITLKRKLFYGWFMLMSFAYGLGFFMILGATFSSFILNLPKPGPWMNWIKKIGASILILSGLYFIISTLISVLR
ncbi:MAG: hypothetical protein NC826_00890 [Candidatus Omnitrophica bacterium]|nr:hypothetical protein [Candidatus Omnitrophota bacterium]